MVPFKTHFGTIVPLEIDNVDTDQIIPKQFLQAVTRSDFGKNLFFNWRYLDERGDRLNSEFTLNYAQYSDASILLAGKNFGCGSSREHAVWALQDFGIKVIVAASFADIFYQNAMNNGLLLIALDSAIIDELTQLTRQKRVEADVDLENCCLTIAGKSYSFEINDNHRHMLMNGIDTIEQTLLSLNQIKSFEHRISTWLL